LLRKSVGKLAIATGHAMQICNDLHYSIRFQCAIYVGSQVRCELANYVSKFENWAWTSQRSSQEYISMFELRLKTNVHSSIIITNSMKYKPSWGTTGPRTFHWIVNFNLNYEHCYTRSSNIEMNLRTLLRSSRPISELGNLFGMYAINLGSARWKMTWNQHRL
jgi:hypothetical protein